MFSATIRELARGNRVHVITLGELQFTSGTMYLHNEGGLALSRHPLTGELEDIQWKGLQGRVTVSNLGASKLGASRQVVCTLNADDATIKSYFFEADQAAVKGRRFRFWGQFLNADLQPIDPRFHIYSGIGDRLRMTKDGAGGRRIELMLEDWFVRRRRSANQMVTHSDQQARDPGNIGFAYVSQMVDKTLNLFDARN